MSILEVHDVSIRYITGDFKEIGLKEYVMRRLKNDYSVNEFWADRHITFSINKGDMLGIIGTNGAGKSTLLKAISGIMEPTEGWIKRGGEVAALLELGSGFDGDLTVKENAYLRGAMLGYTRAFMDETYEQIIDFAELREFENRPFKQLSSGMKSRLAFSIASQVEPDILILDEVLSVGDGAFRKKSEAKMQQILSKGAATILVSHSVAQVRKLCNKVLWLHRGEQITFSDDVSGVCDHYETFLAGGPLWEIQKNEEEKTRELPEEKGGKEKEDERCISIDDLTYDLKIDRDLLQFRYTNLPAQHKLQFAYYVRLNGAIVHKQMYTNEPEFQYAMKDDGIYSIDYFIREGKNTRYKSSRGVEAKSVCPIDIDELCYDFKLDQGMLRFSFGSLPEQRSLKFAYYVRRNGRIIFKQMYTGETSFQYPVENDGDYTITYFVRKGNDVQHRTSHIVSAKTEK